MIPYIDDRLWLISESSLVIYAATCANRQQAFKKMQANLFYCYVKNIIALNPSKVANRRSKENKRSVFCVWALGLPMALI